MSKSDASIIMTVAVLGGTGKEGTGLSMRWALNGYRVVIGSRSEERAVAHAAKLNAELNGDYITGMSNADATKSANIVILSVPYDAHRTTLEGVKPYLKDKVLVDVTVPLRPPEVRVVHVPEGKAAALEAQQILGDDVSVVAAFQNISAVALKNPNAKVDCDVLICGDDAEAKHSVMRLAEAAGMRGIDAGPLANAVAVESITPVLLYINKTKGVNHSGIRITGLDQ